MISKMKIGDSPMRTMVGNWLYGVAYRTAQERSISKATKEMSS